MEYRLQENGFHSCSLQEETLRVEVREHTHASLYVTYDKVAQLDAMIQLQPHASLRILFKNENQHDLQLQVHADVLEDARLQIGFLEVEAGRSDICCDINLKERDAQADMISSTLVQGEKHYDMKIVHEHSDTKGNMSHFAVVEENAAYTMKASGIIVKGAHRSASHQKTRVLTMSGRHRSKVDPILLIDEDDVKASHAMTLGQMDENQLYYLMSRGLTRQEALGLLSVGYLMPICDFFEEAHINASLKAEMEKKVGLHV